MFVESRRGGFTIWELLVVLAIIVALIVLLLPALFSTPGHGWQGECRNNLKQISLALHRYHDAYGSFPPPYIADEQGRPWHSWRVLILPYLDQQALYDEYDFSEPWDGPKNSRLHDRVVQTYLCREANRSEQETSYVAVVGPGTLWGQPEGCSIADVSDGLSNTLAVVEVAHSGTHWMEPRDLSLRQAHQAINSKPGFCISSTHKCFAFVALADGSVQRLWDENCPEPTPPELLHSLLLINDGTPDDVHSGPRHAAPQE